MEHPRLHVALENSEEIGEEEAHNLDHLSREEIENILIEMPLGYRQVFMLFIIDEYSHKEIGLLLNISPEASRSQLSRAKKWLRKKTLTKTDKTLANGL